MSNSTCWLSFFDSSCRSLLPPNNLRDSLMKLFLSPRGKARLLFSVAHTVLLTIFLSQSSFSQELIVNPGFESKLTGWLSDKSPIRTIAAISSVKTGTYSAHINNANQNNEYFYQNLNASPLGNYTFSVWAVVHDASKLSTVGINVYDINRVKIPSASFEMEVNNTEFQKYSKNFSIPADARYFQVFGYTQLTTLKVDDYSLTQMVGGTPTGTVTKNCKIENFRKCDGTNLGYGPWLNILVNNAGGGSNNEYNVNDLTWKEYSDNTATVKGTITKKNDATVAFTVDLLLKGRTTTGTGHFSAVDNNTFCVGQKGADWYFYPDVSGTLIGTGTSVAGSQINVTLDPSMPWQVGMGGTTRFKTSFGSSAWVDLAVVKQPSSSGKTLSIGTERTDFYLEMPGCTPPSTDLCTSFSVSGANTNVTTNGGTNGAINVTLAGGKSPFIYSWSNGAKTEDLTGLEGGTYWLTVTDDNKCVKTYQAVITQPNGGICTGFRTQTQGGWGSKANGENPGAYRDANFAVAFPNGITIGCGTKLLKLTTTKAVEDFLPSGSTPEVLPVGTLTNPAGVYNNVLAGQVVALTLNTGFDNYDATFGSSTANLNNLFITTGIFSGKSVQSLLDEANKALGGCSTTYTLSDINNVVTSVNENYVDGTTSRDFLSCCNNVTSGGTIGSNQSGCSSFDPAAFTSVANPSGGGTTALEFVWLKSITSSVLTTTTQSQWTTIVGATGLTYDSGLLTQTTYFIRCSRRVGCTDYVGESNVITVTINANCGGKDPICLSRKSPVQNSSLCGDATKSYGMWFNDLKGSVVSPSQYFFVKSGELTEFCDGNAVLTYTACVVGGGANDCITATVNYSGRTGIPATGSPVLNTHCTTYNPNVGDWYYYPTSIGSFSGAGIYAGLAGTYTQNMGAFQVGTGGSLNDISKFGASSWFKISITSGGTNNWTTISKDGDVNINLGTSTSIASVIATANPTSICKGENVVLTATIDAASKSANCSPTYSWVGSNGFTSNQATVTNIDVQGATTYTVTVTFTAINGSKCSVTATTSVALNAVCCDNVTNGGQIAANQRNCGAFDPAPFTNVELPTGGIGTLEYIWLKSTTATTFTEENAAEWIPMIGTNNPNLDLNNISVTTAFQRCSRRAGCTDYDGETNVIVVIIDKVPNAPTTTPVAICGTGTVTLGATCTTGVPQWYATSTGGTALATGASFTTPSILVNTTYYVSCKSPEGCESTPRTEAIASINSDATTPTVTPTTICGTGTATLGATCSTGIAQWFAAATGGSSIATGASFTTPSISTTTTYYVSCKSGAGCESARVEVKATVISKITDGGKIQHDESICSGKTPSQITSATPASGGDANLAIEYIWLQTTSLTNGVCPQNIVGQTLYSEIPNTNSPNYQPRAITQTTCYIRCSRRAGCTDYIGGESNIVKKTLLANCQGKDPICLSRKTPVENSSLCGDATKPYGMWFLDLKGNVDSPNQHFSVKSGELTEFCDGTAVLTYTACVTGGGAGDCITATVNYSGRTGTPPVGSPVSNTHCDNYNPNVSDWYYYPVSNGTFSGGGIYAGMTGTYTQNMGAFQVGTGGNLNDIAKFGASSWFKINITNGGTNNWTTASKDGDININLGNSTTIASVTATANPKAICSGEKVDLTATLDVNSKSANCSPSYAWVGSNGFTSTQATATNTNVTTSTTYTVTVTFTAINGSKCSVTATTGVTVNPIPNPPTVTPAAICGTGTVTLGATCSTGTAQWYSSATGGASIATGASFTTPSISATTTYYVSCKTDVTCESARTPVTATINPIPATPTVKPATICGTGTAILGATCTIGVAQWYATATGGASIATGASFTTPSISSTTTYHVSCKTDATCESDRIPVTATVNAVPNAPTVTPATTCGTGSVTLGATCTTGVAQWYSSATGGTALATGASFTTPSLSATTTYYVSCKSVEGCESAKTEVKAIVIVKIKDGGAIKADEIICVGGTPSKITSVTLPTGGDSNLGIEYVWLQTTSLSTNGMCPLNIVGQNLYTEIPNTNTPNYQPGAITVATCYIRCSRSAGCLDYIGGESNTVKKSVQAFPTAPTVTPATICGTGTVTLGAICSTGATAMWYVAPTGVASIATGASFTTPSISATTTYYVSCKTNTAGCESNRTPVIATINPIPATPTVKPAAICGIGTVTLGATCVTGTAMWYTGATGGASVSTGASFTTPSISSTTTYYVSCKIPEGCESGRTPVTATINAIPNAPTVKGAETCGSGSVTLGATCSMGVAQWYAAPTGGSSIATGASFITPSLSITTSYYVSCKSSEGCESGRTDVKATVIGKITDGGSIKADETICVGGTPAKIISVTSASGGDVIKAIEYIWLQTTSLISGACPLNIVGQSFYTEIPGFITPDYQPEVITKTTCYIRCARRSGCTDYIGGESNTVKKSVEATPNAPTVTPAAICGTGIVTLGVTCTTGTAMWYTAATGGASIATGASFSTPSISATNTYYVSCKTTAGECESGRTSVTATTNPIPTVPTVKPAAICGTGTVTLGATCATGISQWYTGATNGALVATGAFYTTPSLSVTTTYFVSCKSTEGCESGRTPVIVTVNSAGTAPTVTPATTCGTGSVTLGATCATGTVTWYSSATGGTAIAMGASFTTPSLSATTSYYVSCKSSVGCESARKEVKATVIGKITDGGKIKADETICAGTAPSKIVNVTLPTGGDASLAIEYIWLKTTSLDANGACPANVVGQNLYTEIPGSITPDYQPGAITQTTCYIRCSRRKGCTDYIGGESNIVKKTVTSPFTISATTNPNAVCNGTTVSITATTTAIGTITYAWAGPNGFTANTKDVSIPNATLLVNGVYTVSASNGGGCKAVATVHVKVINCLKIGDLVFNDKNNTGKQDAGELGIAGVTVKLFDNANNQVGSSTTTDANGKYLFSNLPSGSYVVEIAAPAGCKSSTGTNGSGIGTYEPTTGSTIVNNEDNGTTVGGQIIRSKPVVLTTTDNTNVDFGLFKPAKLGDFVFRDSNGNGIQEAGEIGVAGVTVKLFDSANNVVATTITDANGKYVFDNLAAGNYSVEFVKSTLPSSLGFSPQGATTGDKDSDANVTTGRTAIITLTEGQTNNDIDAGLTGPCDKDVTPPVLSVCPYDILLKTRGTVATVSWSAPKATDNCGTPVITSTKVSGSQFPVGKTVVIYTATDAKGNKTTCSFTVTIIKIITCETDTQAPVFYDCPTDITVNTTGTGATARWDHPSVGDNCGIPTVMFNYTPGQTFPVGVTTVIYTAKDAKGNTSYCMFKVMVIKKTTLSTGPVMESTSTANLVNDASESIGTTTISTSTPITGATSSRVAVVEEVKAGDEVFVYPNPTNSDFSIELSVELMRANISVEVSVFNMTGTTQFSQTAKGTERVSVKVPVQDMPNGTYFVNVALDNGRMIIKKLQIVK